MEKTAADYLLPGSGVDALARRFTTVHFEYKADAEHRYYIKKTGVVLLLSMPLVVFIPVLLKLCCRLSGDILYVELTLSYLLILTTISVLLIRASGRIKKYRHELAALKAMLCESGYHFCHRADDAFSDRIYHLPADAVDDQYLPLGFSENDFADYDKIYQVKR